jgi:hypothetical protein
MEEAFEEGQGPHRAVEPMMMMMRIKSLLKWMLLISCSWHHTSLYNM